MSPGEAPEPSPLATIEARVVARARDLATEAAGTDADDLILSLIDDELAAWDEAFGRGLRAVPITDPARVRARAFSNLARYGPLTSLLEDPDVWEVMVNAPDQVFVRRHSGIGGYHDESFHDDEHVLRTLTKLLDDASSCHRKLDPSEGLQDAQLDDGARVHIVHGDISRGGHVMVNIRRFTGVPFRRLDELVARGMLDRAARHFLAAAVRAGASVVVAGAPGSGKTTLLSCCAAELDPTRRVVVAEEVFEIDVPLANVASLQTRPARADRPAVELRDLVAGFLRMAPDVAIVGEVRDREALPLLLTLSSGVQGFTTIHAGSARQALTRLRFVCQLAERGGALPFTALNALVSETVDVVVHCARGPAGPRVTEIVAVEELAGGAEATQFTVTELFRCTEPPGALAWTGAIPVRLLDRAAGRGVDLLAVLERDGRPVEASA